MERICRARSIEDEYKLELGKRKKQQQTKQTFFFFLTAILLNKAAEKEKAISRCET